MTDQSYVFDTYALLEIIDGNPSYKKYSDANIIIIEFILAELCFNLIRKMGPERGFTYIDDLAGYVIPLNKEIIKKAMLYRYKRLKSNISMTDCTGFFLAKSLGVKFLTGDKEFKNVKDVEFVPKNNTIEEDRSL